MRQLKLWAGALGAALLVAACGGGGGTATSPAVNYSSLVTFGDSLSDAGTLKTGAIASVLGGGRWTINSPTEKIWVDLLAAQANLPKPCPAQQGFNSLIPTLPASMPPVFTAACTNYAQGGSRVTNPIGPGNNGLLALTPSDNSGALGQPTTPVVTQIANHLGKSTSGRFTGTELVTVLAGGNDAFRLTASGPFRNSVTAAIVASGGSLSVVSATQVVSGQVVTAMGQAGAELAAYVRTEMVGKGAKRVVVVNLPNIGVSPGSIRQETTTPGSIALATAMAQQFNLQLKNGLAGLSEVLIVDFYDEVTKIASDASYRAQVGVTNATTPACATTNALGGQSLVCNSTNLAVADPSGYMFADDVHPTPLGHKLLAQRVVLDMIKAGWL